MNSARIIPYITILCIALLIAGCSAETRPRAPRAPATPQGAPAVPSQATSPATPQSPPTASDPCAPNKYDFDVYSDDGNYTLGLRSLTLDDKGGWYKVTAADIFIKAPKWTDNSITLQIAQPSGGLMDFNRQTVVVEPNHGSCFSGNITLSISLRNLTEEKAVTFLFGVNDRLAKELAYAQDTVDLRQYLK